MLDYKTMDHRYITIKDGSEAQEQLKRLIDDIDNQSRLYLSSVSLEDNVLELTWMRSWCPSQWRRSTPVEVQRIFGNEVQIKNVFLPEFVLSPSLRSALQVAYRCQRGEQVNQDELATLREGAIRILARWGLVEVDYDIEILPFDAMAVPTIINYKYTIKSVTLTDEGVRMLGEAATG